MKNVMFTKHLEGYDLQQIIDGLKHVGLDGADLCTRPGYPVNPENCETAMPEAARRFADEGMSIEMCTTPGDFTDPEVDYAERLFAACAAAGVPNIKLGYWRLTEPGYWRLLDECRAKLDGFGKLAEKHGVRVCVHNHSGSSMGLNASAVMRLVEGRDPKHVGVFADCGHLSVVGEPIAMAIDICWDYIAAFALKDLVWEKPVGKIDGTRRLRVVPFGYGNVEWGVLAAELTRRGFDGPVSFHCEYSGYPPECVLGQCYVDKAFFTKLLEQTAEGS